MKRHIFGVALGVALLTLAILPGISADSAGHQGRLRKTCRGPAFIRRLRLTSRPTPRSSRSRRRPTSSARAIARASIPACGRRAPRRCRDLLLGGTLEDGVSRRVFPPEDRLPTLWRARQGSGAGGAIERRQIALDHAEGPRRSRLPLGAGRLRAARSRDRSRRIRRHARLSAGRRPARALHQSL